MLLRLAFAIEQLSGTSICRRTKLTRELTFNFARCLSEVTQSNPIPNNDIRNTEESTLSVRKGLKNYLKNVNPDLLKLNTKYSVKTTKKRPWNLWLVDEATAQAYFSFIIDDLLKNMSLVVQINAGPGILTELLIKAGVKPLYIFDKEVCFQEKLIEVIDKYNERLKESNIVLELNRTEFRALKSLASTVEKGDWNGKSSVQVLLPVSSAIMLRNIITNVVNAEGYAGFGRPIWYCAMYPSIFQKYINTEDNPHKWGTTRVFIYKFFNHKILGEVPRHGFVPWEKKKSYPTGIGKMMSNDWCKIYIVKLEPKPDLFTNYLDQKMLRIFFQFVSQLTWKKEALLIPKIESYYPSFGLKLIEHNYDMSTRVRDLTGDDFYKIFMALREWPDFDKTILQYGQKDSDTSRQK